MPPNNNHVATTLDNDTWTSINELALWAHGQRATDGLQLGTLERLASIVPHRVSMFDLIEIGPHGTVNYVHPASATMSPEILEAYYQNYAAMDYTTWSFDVREVHVYRDLDLVDVERRDATPIYREWMEPQGVYFGCTATLAHSGTPLGTITLFRERAADDFSPTEMRALKEIARHTSIALARLLSDRSDKAENVRSDTKQAATAEELARRHDLNPRETEVLALMLAGHTNRQMAAELFISESTVKKHINAIYRKLGVRNRMELAHLER